jgi:hypothetical protein
MEAKYQAIIAAKKQPSAPGVLAPAPAMGQTTVRANARANFQAHAPRGEQPAWNAAFQGPQTAALRGASTAA